MLTRSSVGGWDLHLLTEGFSFFLLLASVVVLLGVVGCDRRQSPPGIIVTHEIKPAPLRVGPAEITLSLADAGSKPISRAHIALEADMAHPGMAPVFGAARETAPGRYQGRVSLTMGGDWVLLLHITLSDGRTVERQIELHGIEQ